jgi:Fe-S cluster assembly ATP-binding protein
MTLLEIENLSYRSSGRQILEKLSLSLEAGEIHAILGTNGTGKTTLAKLIMGCEEYRPDAGAILFEGNPIDDLPLHVRAQRGISMAWQEPARFEGLTVGDFLALGQKGPDPALALAMAGLDPAAFLERMMDKSLSGGERKRIELASVLVLLPKLAILDEPDSGIDMLSTQDIIDVIRAFKTRGSTVLLITHREEIALIADRASQICGGRIVATWPAHRVAARFEGRICVVVTAGSVKMTDLDKLLEAFRKSGGDQQVFADPATAHLMVEANRILSGRDIEGLRGAAKSTGDGIAARVPVTRGTRIGNPVHLCSACPTRDCRKSISGSAWKRVHRLTSSHIACSPKPGR